MKKIYLALVFGFITLSALAESQITVDVGLSPAGSFQAKSSKAKGVLNFTNGQISSDKISVSIESFKTGIELRDEHFWKHLKSTQFPKATLSKLTGKDGKAQATLEVAGVSVPVSFGYQIKNGHLLATISLKASSFKLSKAEYLGVGVDDSVKVQVEYPVSAK